MEGRDVQFGVTIGLPGKRSVDHTGPLPSSVNVAGLRAMTAEESRSSLKETHPLGREG